MSKLGRTEITKPKSGRHTGTVIFLHGSGNYLFSILYTFLLYLSLLIKIYLNPGGTGQFSKEWVEMLRENASFPHLKIMYPTAPMRPYTPLNGEVSRIFLISKLLINKFFNFWH